MLRSATQIGTAKKLKSLPFAIAAKTGTTGTKEGNTVVINGHFHRKADVAKLADAQVSGSCG